MVFRVCKKNMIFKIDKILRLVFSTGAPPAGAWSRHQVPAGGDQVPSMWGPGARREHQVSGPVENQRDYVMIELRYNVVSDKTITKTLFTLQTEVKTSIHFLFGV